MMVVLFGVFHSPSFFFCWYAYPSGLYNKALQEVKKISFTRTQGWQTLPSIRADRVDEHYLSMCYNLLWGMNFCYGCAVKMEDVKWKWGVGREEGCVQRSR